MWWNSMCFYRTFHHFCERYLSICWKLTPHEKKNLLGIMIKAILIKIKSDLTFVMIHFVRPMKLTKLEKVSEIPFKCLIHLWESFKITTMCLRFFFLFVCLSSLAVLLVYFSLFGSSYRSESNECDFIKKWNLCWHYDILGIKRKKSQTHTHTYLFIYVCWLHWLCGRTCTICKIAQLKQ